MWLWCFVVLLKDRHIFVLLLCILNTVGAKVGNGYFIYFAVCPVFRSESFLRKSSNLNWLCNLGTWSNVWISILILLKSLHMNQSPAFTVVLSLLLLVIWVIVIAVLTIFRSHVKRDRVGHERNIVSFFDVFESLAEGRFLIKSNTRAAVYRIQVLINRRLEELRVFYRQFTFWLGLSDRNRTASFRQGSSRR